MSSPPSQDPNAEAHHFSESVPEGDAGLTMPPIHTSPPAQPTRPPTLRPLSDPEAIVTVSASSTPLGLLKAARRPGPAQPGLSSVRGGSLPQDMQAKMRAFHQSRQGAPPGPGTKGLGGLGSTSPTGGKIPVTMMGRGASGGCVATPGGLGGPLAGSPGAFRLPPNTRPQAHNAISAPVVPNAQTGPKLGGLAAKRMGGGLKLSDAMGPTPPALADGALGSLAVPNGIHDIDKPAVTDNIFNKYSDIVDTKTGTLRFKGKATIDGEGIDFSSGRSFKISLDEVDTIEELGKGNYGTVYQVRHSRPRMRRPGLGLQGNKAPPQFSVSAMTTHTTSSQLSESPDAVTASDPASSLPPARGNTTGLVMAMKEIRLELDEAKFAAIIMELDILHRCTSPFIVDFYGAFFQEGAVYICMEFMDGGSIDKLYGDGIPENVLRKITLATVMGLKSLKDEHNIIHRDVKPTNILANSRGQIKICDFGVSGNLVASIAKTNIGCQSYMAPERIASGGIAQAGANQGGGTYSVQSDIWSLGLSVIECAMGRYPYPPETYNNIFSQLSVSILILQRLRTTRLT